MQQVQQVNTVNYSQLVNKEGKAAIIFVGDPLEETKQSWCPDCVQAEPIIVNFAIPELLKQGYQVYQCLVGDKETWKDQQNPARNSDWIQVQSIPTLLIVNDYKLVKRLEEDQLFTQDALKEFLGL